MTVVVVSKCDGARMFQKMLDKTGIQSISMLKRRITYQTGVADGGADLTLTNCAKGDIIYDVDNDDWYICTVAATTAVGINA